MKRLYHASAASSTPARPGPGNLSPASFILELWGLLDRKNEKSYAIQKAIGVLEALGASVTNVRLPRAAEARATLAALAPETPVYMNDHFTPEQIDAWPEHHSTITRGREQSFVDYLHAQQAMAGMRQEIVAVLRDVDVVALPTGSTFGDTWNAETVVIRGQELPARSRAVYSNGLASLGGHPAVSVPCGFGMEDMLPIGLMLHGRPLEESLLIEWPMPMNRPRSGIYGIQQGKIISYLANDIRRIDLTVGVAYTQDLEQVHQMLAFDQHDIARL